jgi:hypothetical protein
MSFGTFATALQNSLKHLKIYLHESCPACWGTQLSCRWALKILSGNGWKTCSKVSTSCSWQLSGNQSWQTFPARSIEKNPIQPFWKWWRKARSTAFVFKVCCSSIQKFGVIHFQTGAQQNISCQSAVAPRRRARTAHRAHASVSAPRAARDPDNRGRRSDPLTAAGASVEMPSYHDGIFVVSTPSPSSTYLRWLPAPVRSRSSRPSSPRRPPWTPSSPSYSPRCP